MLQIIPATRSTSWSNFFLILMSLFLVACGLGMDTQERLERGQRAFTEGEYRAAIIDAKNILLDEPGNKAARLLLGRASVEIGDGISAEKELRKAVELGVDMHELLVDLGRSMLLQSKFDDVITEIILDLASSDSDRLAVLRMRGDALLGLRQPESARELYTEVLATDSGDMAAQLGVVNSYIGERNFMQARETLNQVLTLDENYVPAWLVSGALYFTTRNFDAAEKSYESTLKLAIERSDKPGEILAWTGIAETRLAKGDLATAKEATDRLLELAPDALATQYFTARVAYMERDFPRAQKELQQVLRVAPDYRPAQMLLGAVHLFSGNLGQAEMYLSSVVAAAPTNLDARKLLAETLLRLKKVNEARDALRPILSSDGSDVGTLGLAARASIESGDFDEAIEYLKRAVAANPGSVELSLDLASVYLAAGRTIDAQTTLLDVSAITAEESYRQELLGVLTELQGGDTTQTLRSATELLERWPDKPRLLSIVGSINFSLGELALAREYFGRALGLAPGNTAIHINLARVDTAEGDLVSARERYLVVLEMQPEDARAMVALARIAATEGDRDEAESWLQRARSADDRAVTPRIILSRLFLARQDYRAAETVAAEAVQLQGSIAELHHTFGLSKRGQRKHGASFTSFERAVELVPSNPEYRLNLAKAHISTGDKNSARQLLTASIQQDPDHVSTGVLLAALMAQMGDGDEAMKLAKELQRRVPESEVPFVLEGELLAARKQFAAATVAYDAALERNNDRDTAVRAFRLRMRAESDDPYAPLLTYLAVRPVDHEVRLILAQGYEMRGEAQKGIEEYANVLAASPDNLAALNNLALMYLTAGDLRAEELARRAYDLAPGDSSVTDTLGWILVNKKSLQEGIDMLRAASILGDGREEIRYHLATGLVKSGDAEEAKNILQDILSAEIEFTSKQQAQELLSTL